LFAGSKRKVEHRRVVEHSLSIAAHIMSELHGTRCPVDQIDSFRMVNLIGRLVILKKKVISHGASSRHANILTSAGRS
jgi:hypothetical protein